MSTSEQIEYQNCWNLFEMTATAASWGLRLLQELFNKLGRFQLVPRIRKFPACLCLTRILNESDACWALRKPSETSKRTDGRRLCRILCRLCPLTWMGSRKSIGNRLKNAQNYSSKYNHAGGNQVVIYNIHRYTSRALIGLCSTLAWKSFDLEHVHKVFFDPWACLWLLMQKLQCIFCLLHTVHWHLAQGLSFQSDNLVD